MTTDTLTKPVSHTTDAPQWLHCRLCDHRLTSAVQPGGAYVNPHGYVHDLLISTTAPGVSENGPIVTEFSWFEGYGWQLAHCSRCHAHVGWCYVATADQQPDLFYGLRRASLREHS